MYIKLLTLGQSVGGGYIHTNIPKSTYEPDRMKGWTMLAFQRKIDTHLTNKPAGHKSCRGDKTPL